MSQPQSEPREMTMREIFWLGWAWGIITSIVVLEIGRFFP